MVALGLRCLRNLWLRFRGRGSESLPLHVVALAAKFPSDQFAVSVVQSPKPNLRWGDNFPPELKPRSVSLPLLFRGHQPDELANNLVSPHLALDLNGKPKRVAKPQIRNPVSHCGVHAHRHIRWCDRVVVPLQNFQPSEERRNIQRGRDLTDTASPRWDEDAPETDRRSDETSLPRPRTDAGVEGKSPVRRYDGTVDGANRLQCVVPLPLRPTFQRGSES